jgi:hypothetical protein
MRRNERLSTAKRMKVTFVQSSNECSQRVEESDEQFFLVTFSFSYHLTNKKAIGKNNDYPVQIKMSIVIMQNI